MPSRLLRFAKYMLVGGSTFVLDLGLLFLFSDFFKIEKVLAAGLSFLVAVTINYMISRKYVFKGTLRSVHSGYINFLLIATAGFVVVTGGMYVLAIRFGINYVLSRCLIALLTGLWNYFMNLFVNFKVASK